MKKGKINKKNTSIEKLINTKYIPEMNCLYMRTDL